MNKNQNEFIIDMLNLVMRFMVAISVMTLMILLISADTQNVIRTIYLFPAPFVFYLIEKKAKHIWSFCCMYLILMVAFILLVPNILFNVLFVLYTLTMAVVAFIQRIKRISTTANTPMLLVLLIVAAYLSFEHLVVSNLKIIFFVMMLIYIILNLINRYLVNLYRYLIHYREVANIPVRSMMNSNYSLFFLFLSICLGAMLLIYLLPVSKVLAYLGSILIMGIRALVKLFHIRLPDVAIKRSDTDQGYQGEDLVEKGPNILYIIMEYILIAIVIGVLIVGLIYILSWLYRRFYGRKVNSYNDQLEFISPIDHMKKDKDRGKEGSSIRKAFRAIFGKSNNEKIRKYYYNAIVKNTTENQLSKNMTPTQLSKYALVHESNAEEAARDKESLLTALYEKSRYSNEECTKKELSQVKELLR